MSLSLAPASRPQYNRDAREQLIEEQLTRAGWDVDDPTQVTQETGRGFVLLGKNAKPLAWVQDPTTGEAQEQAQQNCCAIQQSLGGEVPFCFYFDGFEIYFWDLQHYPPRSVVGFPTRDDLERLQYIRRNRKPISRELINTSIAGRDYQIRAICSVLEGVAEKKRSFLLVMATGTGKTRTCIAAIDALMRAAYVERVLFLVDRIALREQALAAFKQHLPHEPRWPQMGETLIAKDRRVYVATYPTMLNIIQDEAQRLSPHFFDFIVVDESHRSIYNTYRKILDYFGTLTLGLTATPVNLIDRNTFQLFHCEGGLPTFAYTYEEAVQHVPPYLCRFLAMEIRTRFQIEGISKPTVMLSDSLQLIAEGHDIEEIDFSGSPIEQYVTNVGTNTLIVREFMEECIKDADSVLPGKTIFFCASIAHARLVAEIFDSLHPQYRGQLTKVLVSDDPEVYGKGGWLDQFTNNNMPRIAISVDMLDTGIDVREVVNLVFAKPVRSSTKFWQMIGRGTRLLDPSNRKPWCTDKEAFLIIDCWDNFEYFQVPSQLPRLEPQVPLPVRLVGLQLDKIENAIERWRPDIVEREVGKLRKQIVALPKGAVVIREAALSLAHLQEAGFWDNVTRPQIEFLRKNIQPLFRTICATDFKAMRFERDLLEYSLAVLCEDQAKAETLKQGIVEQVSELPFSVSLVKLAEPLIRAVQTNHYWARANEATFDELAEKLGPLMSFRETSARPDPLHLNARDSPHRKEVVEFGPEHEGVSIQRYREMVEASVDRLLNDTPVLRKIKSGATVTDDEVEALAELLHEEHPHMTEELLRQVYRNRKARFIEFIRHILGIEPLQSFPDAVSAAFEQFIRAHSTLSPRQLNFLDLMKGVILEREKLDRRDLISAPFTVIHPQGIRGVFNPAQIQEILQFTHRLVA